MPTMAKTYYTVEEVSQELQVKPITILRYIRSKELVAYKIGNTYRIYADDLKRFMETRRTTKSEQES